MVKIVDHVNEIKETLRYSDEGFLSDIKTIKDYEISKYKHLATSLLLTLHPNPSLELIKKVLFDQGDVTMHDPPSRGGEKWYAVICFIAIWIVLHDELHMGNQHIKNMINDIDNFFKSNWEELPTPCQIFLTRYKAGPVEG